MQWDAMHGLSTRELVEQHQELVFRTLTRLLGRSDEIEDLAQEVFLRLLRGLPQFRGQAKLSTWLYRITVNVAQDEIRRRVEAREAVSLDDPDAGCYERLACADPDLGERLDRGRFLASLEAGLAQLSLPDRAILVLWYQEERSYKEIVEILDLPMGTVKTHLRRARMRLQSAVEEKFRTCRATI
jgi:RNA polymerase sigma-70 factor (ECF subfamily)